MRNNRVKIAAANKYALKRWDEDVERQYLIRVELEQDASRNTIWGWGSAIDEPIQQCRRNKEVREWMETIK